MRPLTATVAFPVMFLMSFLWGDDAMTLRCEAVEGVEVRYPADQQGQFLQPMLWTSQVTDSPNQDDRVS